MPLVRTKPTIAKVALASLVGTTVEWYDFFLYGTATALVFNRLFFPSSDPKVSTLAAFGTYAVGFFARPFGGIVCGHFGDRVGRKSMLVFTLVLMGAATFLIGILPTYATIGFWAPVLLVALRLVQGFGVGGEWGGAVLMAVEHAPKNKRGFYGSWPQIGVPMGLLLSTAAFRLVTPEGWRIAFVASLGLVFVGIFIRTRIEETPDFARVQREKCQSEAPILDVLRTHPRNVLIAMGARLAENGAFYMYSVFAITYAVTHAHIPVNRVLNALLIAAALEFFSIPFFGALSDKIGRRPVYLFGAIGTGVLAYPFFLLIDVGTPGAVTTAMVLGLTIFHAAMYGPQASFFSELFDARVRYSGASLGYQLASVLAGGLAPLVAAALLTRSHDCTGSVAALLIAMSVITVFSLVVTPARTR